MKRSRLAIALLIVIFLALEASAKKIVFYEAGSSSTIENDYSTFADTLRKSNYEIATIEKGDITKDKIENYDILVIINPNKQYSTDEISSILWFMIQRGKGLLLLGGNQQNIGQLANNLGVTVDSGTLIDSQNQIPGLKDRSSFTVDNFPDYPMTKLLKDGVTKIGVYKPSGLIVSGTSMCIATGNPSTYSDTGSFAAGSQPCLAAASKLGGGLAFTLSEPTMLSNAHISDFDNKKFGVNIIDWLGIPSEVISGEEANSTDYVLEIKDIRLQNQRLNLQVKQLATEKDDLTGRFNACTSQLNDLQARFDQDQSSKIMGLDRQNFAIIALGVCIVIGALLYSKKKSDDVKIKDDDILNELGYELDGGKAAEPQGEKKTA